MFREKGTPALKERASEKESLKGPEDKGGGLRKSRRGCVQYEEMRNKIIVHLQI